MTEASEIEFDDNAYAPMHAELERITAVITDPDSQDEHVKKAFKQDEVNWRHVFAVSPFVASYITRCPGNLPVLTEMRQRDFDVKKLSRSLAERLTDILDSAMLDRQLRQFRNWFRIDRDDCVYV